MPCIRGKTCVEALLRAGFERVQTTLGFTVLRRVDEAGLHTVLIPEDLVLFDELVEVLLATAEVTPSEFKMLVAANDVDREQA